MDLNLTGHRVFVTAGAAGIGREVVAAFVEEGARVAACDIDGDAVAQLATDFPGVMVERADVTDPAALGSLIDRSAETMGGLDAMVNNAGIAGPTARVEDISDQDWAQCLNVCLTGQFNGARAAVPHLRRSENASIACLSSAAGKLGFALRTPYAAAKWGVIGFAKSLAVELGPDRIRANAILPGIVAGERQRRVMEAKSQQRGVSFEDIEAEAFSYTSIKDFVAARHVADQILFLASERGRLITGQAVSVCGDIKMLA